MLSLTCLLIHSCLANANTLDANHAMEKASVTCSRACTCTSTLPCNQVTTQIGLCSSAEARLSAAVGDEKRER